MKGLRPFLLLLTLLCSYQLLGNEIFEDQGQQCGRSEINYGLEGIFSFYENLSEEVNQCEQLEIDERIKKVDGQSDESLDFGSISGCLREFVKGVIEEIVATGEGAYEAIKFILRSVVGSARAYYQFLRTAWMSGVSTAVTELLQNGAAIIDRIVNFFKDLPGQIFEMAKAEVTEFNCLNNEGKLEYVCKSFGVIGPELVIGILTGGAALGVRATRVAANFVRDSLSTVARARRISNNVPDIGRYTRKVLGGIEDLPIASGANLSKEALERLTREVQIGRLPSLAKDLEKAQGKILKLDELLTKKRQAYDAFLLGPNKKNRALKRKLQAELRELSEEVTTASRRFGELNTKKTLAEMVDSGKIEIVERLELKNKDVRVGYPEYNEGGVGYKIRLKEPLEICRGGDLKEGFGSKNSGAYFNPCRTRRYDNQEVNANLNATADNTFSAFTRFKFKAGTELDLAAVAPVYSSDGLGGNYAYLYKGRRGDNGKAQTARGLGGNVQFINPDKDNVIPERIRSVLVTNTPQAREIQSDIRRLKEAGDREALSRIRSDLQRGRPRNVEFEILIEEIDVILEGREFDLERVCGVTERC